MEARASTALVRRLREQALCYEPTEPPTIPAGMTIAEWRKAGADGSSRRRRSGRRQR